MVPTHATPWRGCTAFFACALLLILVFTPSSFAQAPTTAPTVNVTTAARTDPSSGPEMFKSYCAACHGVTGKGNGPAAAALKTRPADLTQLSAKNQGKFPEAKFTQILQNGLVVAHGTTDMPTWGPIFDSVGGKSVTQLRIANLSKFVEGLQGK